MSDVRTLKWTEWLRHLVVHRLIIAMGIAVLGLCGLMVLKSVLVSPTPTLATVQLKSILHGFTGAELSAHLPEAEMAEHVRVFSASLKTDLKQIAKRDHLIVVPKAAVIAGNAPDITDALLQRLSKQLPQYFKSVRGEGVSRQ